ncbi:uncharacterized protein PG986_011446 [Apiospora aurea]|uniref:Uncharacterized protein n=1 Tax=Apiospora aurea TaxID=335848 RepID=A0ABR1Q5A7_9PEZI
MAHVCQTHLLLKTAQSSVRSTWKLMVWTTYQSATSQAPNAPQDSIRDLISGCNRTEGLGLAGPTLAARIRRSRRRATVLSHQPQDRRYACSTGNSQATNASNVLTNCMLKNPHLGGSTWKPGWQEAFCVRDGG